MTYVSVGLATQADWAAVPAVLGWRGSLAKVSVLRDHTHEACMA